LQGNNLGIGGRCAEAAFGRELQDSWQIAMTVLSCVGAPARARLTGWPHVPASHTPVPSSIVSASLYTGMRTETSISVFLSGVTGV